MQTIETIQEDTDLDAITKRKTTDVMCDTVQILSPLSFKGLTDINSSSANEDKFIIIFIN